MGVVNFCGSQSVLQDDFLKIFNKKEILDVLTFQWKFFNVFNVFFPEPISKKSFFIFFKNNLRELFFFFLRYLFLTLTDFFRFFKIFLFEMFLDPI